MLLLNLNQIRTAQDRFEQVYRPDQFEADEDFRVVAPVELAFDIFKDKQAFRLAGRLQTTLELKCSRCLEPFAVPVDQAFDLRYQPHTANAGEGERDLMHEQFVLALPMKPLCDAACKGLCPVCGTNLNTTTCDCKPAWEDPRLAVLRELRTKN